MKKYIFGVNHNVHIFDLDKTAILLEKALSYVQKIISNKEQIIFVGTKNQAKNIIKHVAEKCNMPYIINRWLGGVLTNYRTIQKSIKKLNNIEKVENKQILSIISKKEQSQYKKRKEKLDKFLCGIKNMKVIPKCMFVIDTKLEKIAIQEAKKLKISVIALVDSDSSPDNIDYVIPGNDDSEKSISFFLSQFAKKILEVQSTFK
ncbi:UNVERIFIED_CONTAM: hypothetical protein GTU68_031111 [Idotea baltica]|nr:hypothetical protein [Idotea baltica]